MLDRRFAPMASLLAVSVLVAGAASNVQPALAEGEESPSYLPGSVTFTEKPQTEVLRLQRKPTSAPAPDATDKPAEKPQPKTLNSQKPLMDKMPTARALPPQQGSVQEDERAADAASLVLQQSLETLITSCFTMIATGVNAGQLTYQEEAALRQELQQIIALNNTYAANRFTQAEFQQIQAKLVTLQVQINQFGTNGINRW